MYLKNKFWKVATALVVLFLVFNPEMMGLALFIDSIGLELFLMLVETQIIVLFVGLFTTNIRVSLAYLKKMSVPRLHPGVWKTIKDDPAHIVFICPGQATLMHMLVFSAMLAFVFNMQL